MVTLPGLLTGLGLFLFGMLCMTDGLKALACDALRAMLLRFVRGPWSANLGTTSTGWLGHPPLPDRAPALAHPTLSPCPTVG